MSETCEMGFPLNGKKPCAKCGAESNEVCREWVRTAGEQLTTLRAEKQKLIDALTEIGSRPAKMIWGENYEVRDAVKEMEAIARAALQAGENDAN